MLHGRGIAIRLVTCLVERRERGVKRTRIGVPCGDEAVGRCRGEAQHAWPEGGDPHRWTGRSRTARQQLAIVGTIVASAEIDLAITQQRESDLKRLFEPAGEVIPVEAECWIFGLV